jgi:hypothetical protein
MPDTPAGGFPGSRQSGINTASAAMNRKEVYFGLALLPAGGGGLGLQLSS